MVSTRDLFGLFRAGAAGDPTHRTILDRSHRSARSVVAAEHTPYPHLAKARPRYREPLASVITAERKIIARGTQALAYDPRTDPMELDPSETSFSGFDEMFRYASDTQERVHLAAAQ